MTVPAGSTPLTFGMAPGAGCLTENDLLAWMAGQLLPAELGVVDEHVDGCERCQALIGAAWGSAADFVIARPREPMFRPGTLLAHRYRLVRFIARGGMGEVYEVHDLWLNDTAALKTLVAPIADDPSALTRLKAEVLLARRVSHPNVCRVFDFGYHNDAEGAPASRERVAFLTMELLPGETLKARVKRAGPFRPDVLCGLAEQLVAGMAHAHREGVIHRDFKSDNVILVPHAHQERERAVITDFGLARASLKQLSEPVTSASGCLLGTLDYMAPEQVEGRPASRKADVYALGVVLFEALTGRLPFIGKSPTARALERLRSEAPKPSALVADLDPQWDTVIARCLARDPAARYDDIRRLLDDLSNRAPASRAEAPGTRRPRPKRPLTLAMGFVLASAMAGVVWGTVEWTSEAAAQLEVPSPPREEPPGGALAGRAVNEDLVIPENCAPPAPIPAKEESRTKLQSAVPAASPSARPPKQRPRKHAAQVSDPLADPH